MADFLDEGFGTPQEEINLGDYTQAPQQTTTIPPEGAVRNRAATTALLSGNPDEAVTHYRQMLLEAQQGQNTTQQQLQQQINVDTNNLDTKAIMNLLADSTVPFETKQAIVKGYKGAQVLNDNATTLHTNFLAQGSEGESKDQEDARITTADAVAEQQRARSQVQGIVNAKIASTENRGVISGFFDAIASVIPFASNLSTTKLAAQAAEANGDKYGAWDYVKNFFNKAGAKQELRRKIEQMSPQEKVDFTKKLTDVIGANSSVIFGNENQYIKFQQMDDIWLSGYSDQQAASDTLGTLLDVMQLGWSGKTGQYAARAKQGAQAEAGTAKGAYTGRATAGRGPAPDVEDVNFTEVHRADWELYEPTMPPKGQLPNPTPKLPYHQSDADQVARIEANSPVSTRMPMSPGEIANQSNPQQARAIFRITMSTESDEVANAMYGTTKQQAVVNQTFPQASTESGAVTSIPFDMQRDLRKPDVPDELVDMVHNTGAIYFTPAEKARARANIVNDFQQATGMTMNETMSSFSNDGGRISIDAVYGAADGSWSNAQQAMDQAKFALRAYGIDDADITVMRKSGLDHVPVDPNTVKDIPGDYVIRVRSKYEFSSDDIGNFDKLTTRFNWFDRAPALVWTKQGSVSRYILDASSMIDPVITKGAVVMADDAARAQKTMLTYAEDYSKQYVKLDDIQKAKVDDYIREANFNGIPYDQADLIARGFGPNEISSIKAWRDFWDGHFYLENYDVIRSLKNRGFQVFENSQHTLYVKPISKNINKAKVYDASQDIVRTLSKNELDDLYNTGGSLATFRRPVNFNGDTVEQMMVRNTPTEYARGFRDTDQVLNYRQGYFQIHYNAPKFIDEVERDAAGNITSRRTVAVAGDTKEATLFKDRMQTNTGIEHLVRDDFRAIARDSDEYWDLQQASGRIAQRHRGKLLQDASAPNQLGDNSFVLHPVDSAIKAAKSIAGRSVSRQMLDTAKSRILDQFPEAFPSNGMGGRKWPSDIKDVGRSGDLTSKYSADARTNWEYVNYLENGYINSMDEFFKQAFRAIATTAGEKGMSKVERAALGVSQFNPSNAGKGFVFNAYIASNPIRQLIVQPHQAVRTWIYNPKGWLSGTVPNNAAAYFLNAMGLPYNAGKDTVEFLDFMKNFGGIAGVDHNNLVRGTLLDAAHTSNALVKTGEKSLGILRSIGFDAGESANLVGHAAAVFDRYKRLGMNMSDKAVRDEAYNEIRALSWDMNKAGDMPYTQTSASVALQFLQVPHKAWLQATNRRLSMMDKIKLMTFDMAMWGTPIATISAFVGGDILSDDPQTKSFLMDGIEATLINHMLSGLSGEDTNIDFSSLAPYSMDGWGKMFSLISTDGISGVVTNSPAGQLFLKDGGRVQNAIHSMSRWFNGATDPNMPPETFLSTMNEVAKISSGWSNGIKAKILLQQHKVLDQYGNAIDPSVSTPEAWAQMFGFGTVATRDYYAISQKWSKDIKAHKQDIQQVVDDSFRYYKNNLQSENTNTQFVQGVIGMVMQAVKDDPDGQRMANSMILQKLQGEDVNLAKLMMRRSGIPDAESMMDGIRRAPVDDATRQQMVQRYNDAQNALKQLQQMNKEK